MNRNSLSMREDGTFHILQLTDFHNDVSDELAESTYGDAREMVSIFAPDFLAVTGDIWCGDEMPERAPVLMERDLVFLGSLNVPWAFAWGNHDYVGDLKESLEGIASTPNAVAPEGDGRGSFSIEVLEGGGAAWDMFFLNSGTEWDPDRDMAWFETESRRLRDARGRLVPAIVFVHLPLLNYEKARLEGRYEGIAQEEVLCWGDDGSVFRKMKDAGNVRACFVGHSHVNDFYVEEEGIVLAYGRATGHGGYGGDRLRKGAKRIVLDGRGSSFSFETVFPDGSRCMQGTG